MIDTAGSRHEEDIEKLMGHFGLKPPGPRAVFAQLRRVAEGHGALEAKVKALLALGVCVESCRTDSIRDHIQSALSAGASQEEILEVVGTAILMGGQHSIQYGLRAEEELIQATVASQ